MAQAYDRSAAENIFVYEKLNKNRLKLDTPKSPTKKNLIAVAGSKKSNSSHLILTNTQAAQQLNQAKVADVNVNSMPHVPQKDSLPKQMSNSQSFDFNLNEFETKSVQKSPTTNNNNNNDTSTPQQKPSMSVLNSISNRTSLAPSANSPGNNSPRLAKTAVSRTSAQNWQKFHSFQKPSFSTTENKCTCFNMQFVCEICTTRYFQIMILF